MTRTQQDKDDLETTDPSTVVGAADVATNSSQTTIEPTTPSSSSKFELGGDQETPAVALLTGVLLTTTGKDTNKDSPITGSPIKQPTDKVVFPISTLPTILGRTHERDTNNTSSSSVHFCPMGSVKALSREQILIQYLTRYGGQLVGKKGKDENDLSFVHESLRLAKSVTKTVVTKDMRKHQLKALSKLAKKQHGSFVITCIGKNRILVNGQRVEPGEAALLANNNTIAIGGLRLYFVLPIPGTKVNKQATVSITTSTNNTNNNKRKQPKSPVVSTSPSKKPKPVPIATTTTSVTSTTTSLSNSPSTKRPKLGGNTGQGATWSSLQSEIESMSTDDLLAKIDHAVKTDTWERRHQLIGSTISYRAVIEAAEDAALQQQAKQEGGVARSVIMDWITTSPRFGEWVEQMLSKLEDKSYQASVTKALIKAGYTRTATTGRYIKWNLPDASKVSSSPTKKTSSLITKKKIVKKTTPSKAKAPNETSLVDKESDKEEGGDSDEEERDGDEEDDVEKSDNVGEDDADSAEEEEDGSDKDEEKGDVADDDEGSNDGSEE